MFVVTNRKILRDSGDSSILGSSPNEKGPHELRLVEATRRGKNWSLKVLSDKVDPKMRDAVGAKDRHVVSYVTCKLLDRVNPRFRNPKSRAKGRNLLVFVHGFNNDVEDVLERSWRLAKNYGVELLPFSWPANGGGVISGTASYKSDKRDAKASIGALDRILHALEDGCPFTVNFMAHSMGNYLYKPYGPCLRSVAGQSDRRRGIDRSSCRRDARTYAA